MNKDLTFEELKNLNEASVEEAKNRILSLVDTYLVTKDFIISRLNKYNIDYTYVTPTFSAWVRDDGTYGSLYIETRPQIKVANLNLICLDKGFGVELLNFLSSSGKPTIAPYNTDGETKFPFKDIDIIILKPYMFAYEYHKLALDVLEIERLQENFYDVSNLVFEYNEEQGSYPWEVDNYEDDDVDDDYDDDYYD